MGTMRWEMRQVMLRWGQRRRITLRSRQHRPECGGEEVGAQLSSVFNVMMGLGFKEPAYRLILSLSLLMASKPYAVSLELQELCGRHAWLHD